jgi:hypothetical protein
MQGEGPEELSLVAKWSDWLTEQKWKRSSGHTQKMDGLGWLARRSTEPNYLNLPGTTTR